LRESGTSNRVVAFAEPQGKVGHYLATITLPVAGTWEWSIDAFGFAQVMPPLTVGGASLASTSAVGAARGPWAIAFGLAAMAVLAGVGIALVRKRARWATALAPIAVVLGLVGFLTLRDAPSATGQELAGTNISEGQALFVAKGCVVCHAHSAVSQVRAEMESQGWGGFSTAPDLTGRTFSRSFLVAWLENPQATKPGTQMPNLELGEKEILALADFINGGDEE
jgi:cytochrome c2